jgi:CspA family cold shock protein
MKTGVVHWFNDSKGYGFLREDGSSTDIFVHYTAIAGDGFKTLADGQRVTFEVGVGRRGEPNAVNVSKEVA